MDFNFTEKLINEIRNRPILYSVSHPDFKNNAKKLLAWEEIQEELNEEVEVLKAKWKNLKDTYTKYKHSKLSTSSEGAKKLKNWAWADHMRFIDPSATQDMPQNFEKVECEVNPMKSISIKEETSEDSESTHFSCTQEEIQSTQQIYKRRQRRNNVDRTEIKTHYLSNSTSDRNITGGKIEVQCDGVDLLFLGYADSFKNLSKRKQVKLKFDIAKMFMEAELSDLDDATSESYWGEPEIKKYRNQ